MIFVLASEEWEAGQRRDVHQVLESEDRFSARLAGNNLKKLILILRAGCSLWSVLPGKAWI